MVLPVSVFERAGQSFFNTVVIIDADGKNLGFYRKSHIPDGPGYSEKFYFTPGDTGFRVWDTAFGRIGVGICWDQWFPESARAMALMGAELLFYPTAIGSEPQDPTLDSRDHWQRAMQGHAASNVMPLIASNRIGTEQGAHGTALTFYGSSFIADRDRRENRRSRAHRGGGADRPLRPRRDRAAARLLGRVPRPPPGTLCAAAHARWPARPDELSLCRMI